MNQHHHFIIYKPQGVISQFTTNQKKGYKKKLLGELYNFPEGTMAIGRLDENSEGLLLLTTEGKVSEQVRSRKVEKEYYIQVDGEITTDAIEQLKIGVEIGIKGEKYTTLPCKAFKLNKAPNFTPSTKKIRDDRHGPTSWVSITVTEGKFRQVRKMSAAVGYATLRLVRVRVGKIKLNNMTAGDVIKVDHLKYD
ncbi:MAG: pseudouridine synthase [Vicingaceae bacterium]|nr:pseudouridine synthase [Vicingaceae bacterium]